MNTYAASMMDTLYGNPHSEHKPSRDADARVERTRRKALEFFNADPEDFDLIFTPNATGAIKLVHDCFRDYSTEPNGRNWWYGYHKDSHTSVVGVREGTRTHRCFRNDREVDLWIKSRGLGGPALHEVGLFAYPGQSNMTGRRFPLDWPARIRNRVKAEVYTLLDAAALASTAQIDLSNASQAPDLIAISFYKIFGFPNLGALLVRKASPVVSILQKRKFFGGGTVDMVISGVHETWVDRKTTTLHSRLEDGTLPFTNIFALDIAIDIHIHLYGPRPMSHISNHTSRLTKLLYDQLRSLHHATGLPLLTIYQDPASIYGDPRLQGATIAFNVHNPSGGLVSYMDVERDANERNIFVRSGSLCNPGGFATFLNWTPQELREARAWGHKCSEPEAEFRGKALGVVRASLGAMSSDDDVRRFVAFLREVYVDRVYEGVSGVGDGVGVGGRGGAGLGAGGGGGTSPEIPAAECEVSSTKRSAGARDVVTTAAVFKVSDDLRAERLRAEERDAASFWKGGLFSPPAPPPPPTMTTTGVGEEAGGEEEEQKSMSGQSGGSRIRRVRRSIMGAWKAR